MLSYRRCNESFRKVKSHPRSPLNRCMRNNPSTDRRQFTRQFLYKRNPSYFFFFFSHTLLCENWILAKIFQEKMGAWESWRFKFEFQTNKVSQVFVVWLWIAKGVRSFESVLQLSYTRRSARAIRFIRLCVRVCVESIGETPRTILMFRASSPRRGKLTLEHAATWNTFCNATPNFIINFEIW